MKSVIVFDITRIVPLGPQPTVVVTAMFWPGAKLMFDVPGKSPDGQALAKPPPSGPAIVRLFIRGLALEGTRLWLSVVSIGGGVFDAVGALGWMSSGSAPGRES